MKIFVIIAFAVWSVFGAGCAGTGSGRETSRATKRYFREPCHTLRIKITNRRGLVGATLRSYRGWHASEEIWSRDSDNDLRVMAGETIDDLVQIPIHGTYVFDLSEWDDNPFATVRLDLNGKTIWRATGSGNTYYEKWAVSDQASNVRITDDREVAFDL